MFSQLERVISIQAQFRAVSVLLFLLALLFPQGFVIYQAFPFAMPKPIAEQ